jgi:plastocyanin
MPVHIATVASVILAAAAPAHAARAHLPLSRHVAAASSLRPPPPTSTAKTTTQRRPQRAVHARAIHHRVAHSTADPAVTIADFHFTPPSTTVHVGDTITWTNDGPSSHTATASDGSFNTGTLRKGQSASHTFTKPGTYAYVCTIHPFMHGTITVLAAATSTPTPTTTTPTTTPAPTPTTSGPPSSATPQTLATKPARAQTAKPTLPVTGMDLLGAIAAAAILVGSGLALRRAVA